MQDDKKDKKPVTERDLTKDQKIIDGGETNQKLIKDLKKELEAYYDVLEAEVRNLKLKVAKDKNDKESSGMIQLLSIQKLQVMTQIKEIGNKQLKKLLDEAKTNEAQLTDGIRNLTGLVKDKSKTVNLLKTKIADFEKKFKFLS